MKIKRTQEIRILRAAITACVISLMAGQVSFASENRFESSLKTRPDIKVEYQIPGSGISSFTGLPSVSVTGSGDIRITTFLNNTFQVIIREIDRGSYTEINGELTHLKEGNSCVTLRIIFPLKGEIRKWYHGLDKSELMKAGTLYSDTRDINTVLPPDGAFNGKDLADGGYGDPAGKGTISFYPLCAVSTDSKGFSFGVDPSLPVVYRLTGEKSKGIFAELDLATSPLTTKFPGRAFFRLVSFDFDPEWGMRAALEKYYSVYSEAFRKRVTAEGIWLPFTALRSIDGWQDFGFAYHETSWGSQDKKDGVKTPNIISDRGTGVLSFQYTEPWDVQIPVSNKSIPYDSIASGRTIPFKHMEYLGAGATFDKNGLWQARRLNTPWFRTGWAVSITTNCDPDLPGFNRYNYILKDEINKALQMNVDGIYFDSMEWNWHNDLNYREEHFQYTDYPLTFSGSVAKPAIWNFASEFEFMKKISDEMHLQGKLAMGNGHAWNPFAASNLDLFGAELSWYSSYDHDVEALDFKRAISYQKPIVFLLNEGLNDKAFTEPPYYGYEVYFEKMMAYGFFPSFFSVDASNDPYWQDKRKIENGRPFFKKYIPLIKEISGAGWQPVTLAETGSPDIRIERFGNKGIIFFTVRNNGKVNSVCKASIDLRRLGIKNSFKAMEMVEGKPVAIEANNLTVEVPAQRTRVIRIESE